jgi:hypothetical protein
MLHHPRPLCNHGYLQEFQISFKGPAGWLLLGIALVTAFALGWRKETSSHCFAWERGRCSPSGGARDVWFTWSGEADWMSDPEVSLARVVIGGAKGRLVSLLRTDPRFELAYEDDVAAVFVARRRDSD